MGNMGTVPAVGYESSVTQTFSTPTGTTHTLDYSVASVSDILVIINNVLQEPTVAFTVSGTTLTTASLASPDTMHVYFLALSRNTISPSAGSVGTSTMVDDSVTLAKMASGTDGNLITYDASGNPAYVVTGNSGQVLTSGGAGVAPTMQTPAGGGGSAIVSRNVLSGSSGIDLIFDNSTYDHYEIRYSCSTSAGVHINLTSSTDGGSTFDTGSTDYFYIGVWMRSGLLSAQVAGSGGDSKIVLTSGSASNANESDNLTIQVNYPEDTEHTGFTWARAGFITSSAQTRYSTFSGHRHSATNVDAIRIAPASGTITGIVTLIGFKKS